MKLPFKKEEFLGNVRSGKKRENNSPCNTEHFNVYHDSYTSEYAIELFESVYKTKTNTLKIIPIMNILVNNEIYGKEVKCRGESGRNAMRISGKGERSEISCNPETCQYFQKGKCTRTGKLYFRIVGIEDKGIWCYSTKSSGIDFIEKYLNFMNEKGIDITKNQFLLTLNAKQGQSGKVYVPDIKLVKNNSNNQNVQNKNMNNNAQPSKDANKQQSAGNVVSEQKNVTTQENKKLYKYIEGKMVEYKSQRVPKLIFTNNQGKQNVFFLTKASKTDILRLGAGTEIEIIKVLSNKDNEMFLMDYNVIKKIEKTKKAV